MRRLLASRSGSRTRSPEAGTSSCGPSWRADRGLRFGWLKGAVDPDDIRQLVAPVIQQMLLRFASKLPIPGFSGGSGGGGGGGGSGLGGLVGMIGKQVQKSAGQLAEAGKSVMNSVARDFSRTATTEFRAALAVRMKSDEGKKIVLRIRERVVDPGDRTASSTT